MDEDTQVLQDDQETPEGDSAPSTEKEEVLSPEEIADLKKRADASSKNFERAKKAEEELKELKKPKEFPPQENKESDLSSKDIYALSRADVHEDDVDEVVKASKLLGKTISETLKDSTMLAILEKRKEHRKTAEATNTQPARPGTKKITDSEIVARAAKGEIPERGSDEAERLFWARRGRSKE